MTDLAQQLRDRINADKAHHYSAVLDLHQPIPGDASWCNEDGFIWPCNTIKTLALAIHELGSSP